MLVYHHFSCIHPEKPTVCELLTSQFIKYYNFTSVHSIVAAFSLKLKLMLRKPAVKCYY